MILQYRGYKNNWCYEEAERVSSAFVNVDKIIKEAKAQATGDPLEQYKFVCDAVFDHIDEELGSFDSEKIFHCDKMLYDLTSVCAVMLEDKNKNITRIFSDTDVYLLNSKGQTVQKILSTR